MDTSRWHVANNQHEGCWCQNHEGQMKEKSCKNIGVQLLLSDCWLSSYRKNTLHSQISGLGYRGSTSSRQSCICQKRPSTTVECWKIKKNLVDAIFDDISLGQHASLMNTSSSMWMLVTKVHCLTKHNFIDVLNKHDSNLQIDSSALWKRIKW